MRRWTLYALASLIVAALAAVPASAQTFVSLTPDQDNTLFEPQLQTEGPVAVNSNGAGPHVYIGSTISGAARRAVIRFDTSSIPPGTVVQSATLSLNLNLTVSTDPHDHTIHRLTTDWGEGASNSITNGGGGGGGGTGAPAEAMDATWLHTFFDTDFWTTAGGDFAPVPSATTSVGGFTALGSYTWGSTAEMVADVQAWVDDPATNFGWIVIGDESTTGTARRFDSREALAEGGSAFPTLVVGIGGPTSPVEIPTLSQWGLILMAGLMLAIGFGWVARSRRTA